MHPQDSRFLRRRAAQRLVTILRLNDQPRADLTTFAFDSAANVQRFRVWVYGTFYEVEIDVDEGDPIAIRFVDRGPDVPIGISLHGPWCREYASNNGLHASSMDVRNLTVTIGVELRAAPNRFRTEFLAKGCPA